MSREKKMIKFRHYKVIAVIQRQVQRRFMFKQDAHLEALINLWKWVTGNRVKADVLLAFALGGEQENLEESGDSTRRS